MSDTQHNYAIYDIEVLPNVFTLVTKDYKSGRILTFEISPRRNDLNALQKFCSNLAKHNYYMVGFNSDHYDYPILHTMLHIIPTATAKEATLIAYTQSRQIFENGRKPFPMNRQHRIWENNQKVKQIDLWSVHHFNNPSKRVSLKKLEFNMRMRSIKEFELNFDEPIKSSKALDDLIEYNIHDVEATEKFFTHSKPAIEFRHTMTEQYGISLMNKDDTGIGEWYLMSKLESELGWDTLYYRDENGRRIKKNTPRDRIKLADIIFDSIRFKSSKLQELLSFLNTLTVFNVKQGKGYKFKWNENDDYLERMDELEDHHITVEMDNCEFVIGKGGLHAINKQSTYHTTDTHKIIDVDVESFYPSIAIVNGLYPEHLTPLYTKIYGEMKAMRVLHDKHTPINMMLKLALNGSYGKTNSPFSSLYDPKYMLTTTINGQLLLLQLWDALRSIPGIELIQGNTDGITIYVPKVVENKAMQVCKDWEVSTLLKLDYNVYSSIFMSNVNQYIAQDVFGNVKEKGGCAFTKLEWHKDFSNLASRKAVYEYIVNNISIEQSIINNTEVYDFFKLTNLNRQSVLLSESTDGDLNLEQRCSRYLVTSSGSRLYKVMPPTDETKPIRIGRIEKGYLCEIVNDDYADDIQEYDIDYDYYINEAYKILQEESKFKVNCKYTIDKGKVTRLLNSPSMITRLPKELSSVTSHVDLEEVVDG